MSSLYPRPMDAILGAIASQNGGVTLVEGQYTYSAPVPFSDPSGQTNTQLTITAIQPDSPYQGAVTVNYKRLNLADLTHLLPLPVQGNGWVTVADFWAVLNSNFGLNFVAGDLNDTDALVIASDGSGSVTLTAQANSLGWIGTVTLPFIKGNYDLATAVTVTTLPGLMYPNRDETKPYGELYSYWRDMTAYEDDFGTINTSTTDLSQVAVDLTAQSGNAWVTNASGRYSLKNATVSYNGLTSSFVAPAGCTTTPNPAYQSVLVIQLDPTQSLGYSGWLFLHYGFEDPFNPSMNTSLLLHLDGADGSTTFIDEMTHAVTPNANAVLAADTGLAGTASMSSNYPHYSILEIADAPDLRLPNDFTIEFLFQCDAPGNGQVLVVKSADGVWNSGARIYVAGGLLGVWDDTGTMVAQANAGVSGALQAIAVVKQGTTWTIYQDGNPVGTGTSSNGFGVTSGALYIGGDSSGQVGYQGHLDEVRISTVARYTAAYTPATTEFTVD